MALTIDTTIGGALSNSYASEAEALAWFEALPTFFDYWSNTLTADGRKAKLIESTRAIDRYVFIGSKNDEDQALEFPRNEDDEIPDEVKEAQYHMIIFQTLNPSFTVDSNGNLSVNQVERQIQSVSVAGVVSVAYGQTSKVFTSAAQGSAQQGSMDAILALLRDWLASGPNNFAFVK